MRYGVSWAALACALGTYSVAQAQTQAPDPPVPIYMEVDGNGVDVITGVFNISVAQGAIGPKSGGLARQFLNLSRDGFYGALQFVASTVTVAVGTTSETFTLSGSTYICNQASGSTLTTTSNGYLYSTRDGTQYTFVAENYLDSQQNLTPYTYVLTTIVSPTGETTSLSYHRNGTIKQTGSFVLTSVNNNRGLQIKYTSSDSFSTQSGLFGVNNSVEECSPTATSCTFSNSWPAATISGVTVSGTTWTDSLGRSINYGVNGVSYTQVITKASGGTLSITRDSNDRVTAYATPYGQWTYAYSTSGTTQTTTVTDPNGDTNTYVSNTSLDVVTSFTDGLGRVTRYAYDSYGRMTSVTYPDSDGVQYVYDTHGNITQTTRTPIPGTGLSNQISSATFPCTSTATCSKPSTTTDAKGNVTSYTYDATTGVLLSVTKPAGANGVQPQTRYSYSWLSATYLNSSGQSTSGPPIYLLTSTSTCNTEAATQCIGTSDETRTTISYSASQNLAPVAVTVAAGDGSVSSSQTLTYDIYGNLLTSTNASGAVTSFIYDADREEIGVVAPAAGGTGQTTHAAERITYNPDGYASEVEQGVVNSASASDWANFSSQTQLTATYDSADRDIQDTLSGGGTVQSLTQYSYDAANRPICTAVRMNAATFGSEPAAACTLGTQGGDGFDRITQYTYDAANELTQVVSGLGTSVQKTVERVAYENDGHISYIWDGNGNLTTNYWDGFGRLGVVQYPSPSSAGSSNPNDYVAYTFDADSNVTAKRQRDGTTLTMAYDAGNHMTTGGDGATYTYDNFGQVRTANYGGRNLSFAYDALGRMTSQTSNLGTLSYSYDAVGDRTSLVWPDGFAIGFYYNADSTLQGFFEGTGSGYVPTVFYYNGLGQLDTIGRSSGVADFLAYDPVSRINGIQLGFPSGYTGSNTSIGITYNEASQAKNISNTNGLYDWPAPANFSTSYGINGLNQITSSNSYTFTYDAKGDLISDGVNSYSYDVLNRLIHGPNGVSFSYDALGRLASTTNSSGVTTQYLYDGQNLVATYDGSGNLQNRYVFGQGTDRPVMWYNGSGTSARRFLSANQQGSIIAVTDINGNLLAANTYDEFGVPGSNNQGAFQYTGQLWQPDSGLYYYKARIYSPTLGRFLQTDPIGYGDGTNWYNYVHGDPVNGSDPSGLDGNDPCIQDNSCSVSEVVVTASGGGIASGGGFVGKLKNLIKFLLTRPMPLMHLPQNTNNCPGGARLQISIGFGGTSFVDFGGGAATGQVGISIPLNGSLVGTQFFAYGELDPLIGSGLFAGAGIQGSAGVGGAITPGLNANPVGFHTEGGGALIGGATVGGSYIPGGASGSGSPGKSSVRPEVGAGGYVGGGPAFSGQLASPQIGCHG